MYSLGLLFLLYHYHGIKNSLGASYGEYRHTLSA